ncbi:hypothetical protein MVES_002481 [Malassezia vespertilionis]|uniref:Protection of telomeres protein 1 n=1 Tax=Malassezia vespertilionis TaxID=2020962 RepID=A0A2N1JB30_9BASI|nr:hypothetical protein MVES_002481 [Malassezia vespertilionis]
MRRIRRGKVHRVPDAALSEQLLTSSFSYPVCVEPFSPLSAAHGPMTPHAIDSALQFYAGETPALGTLVDMHTWMKRVAAGRGALVCVAASIVMMDAFQDMQPPFFWDADGTRVPVQFVGQKIKALYAALATQEPFVPVPLFLSGYGAELMRLGPVQQPKATVVYNQARVALKALLANGESVWFDCNKDGPVNQVVRDAKRAPRQASPAPSVESWFPSADVHASSERTAPMPGVPSSAPSQLGGARKLGNYMYTPITHLELHSIVNVMGIATMNAIERPPAPRFRDTMVKLTIADGSHGGPHMPLISSNLFSTDQAALPGTVVENEAVLFRGLQIGTYNGKPQGVANRKHAFSWAVWNATSRTWRYSSAHDGSDFTDTERTALLDMVAHLAPPPPSAPESGTPQASIAPGIRPTVNIEALQPFTFVDIICVIVKVFPRSIPPDIYVTDYTVNEKIYSGNDRCLGSAAVPLTMQRQFGDQHAGSGCVLQVGLWGEQAPLVAQLEPGLLVCLENVRIKENGITGFLTGALGSPGDRGVKIRAVDEHLPAVQALLARRDAKMGKRGMAPPKRPADAPLAPPPPVRHRAASATQPVRAPGPIAGARFPMDDDA